jgi:hypothetical protein
MHAPASKIDCSQHRAADTGRPTLAVLFVAMVAAVSVPVLTHPAPPLTDYMNNLARAHVIAAIATDADLQRFYAIEWRVIPNLMIDLMVPVLNRFMSIYLAGQVFTVAALALILSGTLALHRALFGRWSVVPLLAGVLLYNEVLLVGVMNYVFGIGLALWALAAWVTLRERAWPWRYAVSTLFVLLLFVCHLFVVGLYGLGLLAFESHRLWAKRHQPLAPRLIDFAATGLPFVPAALLLLQSATWGLASGVFWNVEGKLDGHLMPFTVYFYPIAYLIVAVLAAGASWAAWRGVLRLHPIGWFLLAIGAVVYLAMPRAVFASHLADQRLPAALAFMLIACLELDLSRRRVRQVFAVMVIALLAVRLAEVQLSWNRLALDLDQFRASVLMMERGARVLVVHGDRDAYNNETGTISDFGLMHAASRATIERAALVSTNFTVPGKHVLRVRPAFRHSVESNDDLPPSADWLRRAADPPDESETLFWSQWPRKFDYVYVLFVRAGDGNPDERHLRLTAEGPGFRLYRVSGAD